MAIGSPSTYTYRGVVFRLTGTRLKARTVIEIARRGRWKDVLLQHPEVGQAASLVLYRALVADAPVDTGQLKASIRREPSGRVSLGPEPYNRNRLKARQAGRVYKPRKKAPKLSKFYAFPANQTSFSPMYLEGAMMKAAREVIRLGQQYEREERRQPVAPTGRLRYTAEGRLRYGQTRPRVRYTAEGRLRYR